MKVLILCTKELYTLDSKTNLTKNINSLKFIFFLSMPKKLLTSGPISKGASPYYNGLLPTITNCCLCSS